MSNNISDIKKLKGQPWSVLVKLLRKSQGKNDNGIRIKKFENSPNSSSCIPNQIDYEDNKKNIDVADHVSCIKLKRTDMGIFGVCPKTEVFQLAICHYCGNKYKLAALSEHISLRHEIKKSPDPSLSSKVKSSLQKRKKSRKSKEKSHEKIDRNDSNHVQIRNHVVGLSTVKEKEPLHPVNSENASNVKHMQVKIKKVHKNVDKNVFSKENSPGNANKQVLKNGIINTKWNENKTLDSKKSSIESNAGEAESGKCVTDRPSHSQLVHFSGIPVSHSQTPTKFTSKEDEVLNMQPVVQLSPLSSNTGTESTDHKKKRATDKKNNHVRDRTYNPDVHCGVIGKENTKPCTRSLTCKSHSMTLRRAVRGRSKAFDELLADHRAEKESLKKLNLESQTPYIESEGVSMWTKSPGVGLLKSSNVTSPTPTPTPAPLTDKSESVDVKNKVLKRLSNERPRLSLPVSIKNPNILSQLQNKAVCNVVLETDEGQGSEARLKMPPATAPPPATASTEASTPGIAPTTALGTVAGAATASATAYSPSPSFRNSFPSRASKENTTFLKSHRAPGHRLFHCRSSDYTAEGVQKYRLGYRRFGGLLYCNNNFPKFIRKPVFPSETSLTFEDPSSFVVNGNVSANDYTSEVHDNNVYNSQPEYKKIQLDLGPGGKKAIATFIPKQATSLLMPLSNQTHQQQKLSNTHLISVNKNSIIKRSNNYLNIPQHQNKVMRREGMFSVVSSDKKESESNIMQIEVASSMMDKQIYQTTTQFSGPNQLVAPIQTTLNSVRGNSFRVLPPRVHYVTASGPLPVTVQQVPVIQQLQLKPFRIQEKIQLLSPEFNISSTGLFYIQKTSTK